MYFSDKHRNGSSQIVERYSSMKGELIKVSKIRLKIVQGELKNELAPIGHIAIIRFIIVIYLSFLNCGRLLIREVQWFYWTLELLVPAEKFTVRMPTIYDVFFP